MAPSNEILYVLACAGYGTRLRQPSSLSLPKVLCPLDQNRGLTPLEYHLRMLKPSAQIGIMAGEQKDPIEDYLEGHDWVGHEKHNFYWIPSRYKTPEIVTKSVQADLPDFPYGAGTWLVFEESLIKDFQKRGVSIIVQTDGNKVGERLDVVEKMIQQIQKSSADWIVAVYNDIDQQVLAKPDWHRRFDLLVSEKGYPKGYAPSQGEVIAGWYVFRISCLQRLWNSNIRKSIEENAAKYPQTRQYYFNNDSIELKIVEINMPLLLEYFQLETFAVSRNQADLGIGLKTASDISKCKAIFEKRESEGVLRKR